MKSICAYVRKENRFYVYNLRCNTLVLLFMTSFRIEMFESNLFELYEKHIKYSTWYIPEAIRTNEPSTLGGQIQK